MMTVTTEQKNTVHCENYLIVSGMCSIHKAIHNLTWKNPKGYSGLNIEVKSSPTNVATK